MTNHHSKPPQPAQPYNLRGPQVQPDAGFWHLPPCPPLCIVRPTEVDPPPSFTGFDADDELAELHELAQLRDDPQAVANRNPANRRRLAISPLLQLRPPPLGAQFDRRLPDPHPLERVTREHFPVFPPGPAVVRTGRQLARLFENEPPGQPLRHALDALLTAPQPGTGVPYHTWSPPLTALAFVAFDLAVYSAQLAAWHYKFSQDPAVGFRPRPVEVDPSISVLFDRAPNDSQSGDGAPRPLPMPSPGTPRHPAYPSGHSVTYGAAAQLLAAFFPERRAELDMVADNAGLARLWAGIHYRSDHEEGVQLGRRVADRVLEQIRDSCIQLPDPCVTPDPCQPPATAETAEKERGRLAKCCEHRTAAEESAAGDADEATSPGDHALVDDAPAGSGGAGG